MTEQEIEIKIALWKRRLDGLAKRLAELVKEKNEFKEKKSRDRNVEDKIAVCIATQRQLKRKIEYALVSINADSEFTLRDNHTMDIPKRYMDIYNNTDK